MPRGAQKLSKMATRATQTLRKIILIARPAVRSFHGVKNSPPSIGRYSSVLLRSRMSHFSSDGKGPAEEKSEKPPQETASSDPESGKSEPTEESLAEKIESLEAQLKVQKDGMLRALADGENARTIARRDVENAQVCLGGDTV